MQPTNLADLSEKLAAASAKGPGTYEWNTFAYISIEAAPAMIAELEALRAALFTAQQYAALYNSPEVQAAIYWMREKGSMHQALELWREHSKTVSTREGK